ncbi:hypothetical protein T10_6087 [Trichinella papuae]|uniref:Uncharacterized protein n=1 Tax=Trichinella papuae TaxID=268474 RepID=A0A0V1M1M3_9BILA|nr:hypothetical protein T10_6087 [Trichinella papuae]
MRGVRLVADRDVIYHGDCRKASSPGEAQLGKSGKSNPVPRFGKVALNGRYQGCFEITNKFRRIKLDAKFFRFGMEHFKYPAIRGQIFPNSQTIYDG